LSAEHPPEAAGAADEVIDAIAAIEMQRRETEKEAGFAISCSSSLHRLRELLDHETEALRLRGPETGHRENVDALSREIERVRKLTVARSQNSFPRSARNRGGRVSWQDAPRSPANRWRTTRGRGGGR